MKKFATEWFATGLRFSPGTPVSSTNKTDRHNITEILLKVALNTITLTPENVEQFIINLGFVSPRNESFFSLWYLIKCKNEKHSRSKVI